MILHSIWLIYAQLNHLSQAFYWMWGLAWFFWLHQWYLLSQNDKQLDFKAFKLNAWYGLWMWVSLMI